VHDNFIEIQIWNERLICASGLPLVLLAHNASPP